jgi:PKD repeat protein
VQNKPLTIGFTGSRSGGASYRWDFGDGTSSTEADPRHTYARVGGYQAELTVTYADGETRVLPVAVTVGCSVPDNRDAVWVGASDSGVANKPVGGGCTVNDLIDDESPWPDHGSFVRHVTAVADQVQRDGGLTGRENSAIVRAAAGSDIGTARNTGYESIFDGTQASLRGWVQAPSGSFSLQPDGSLRSSGGLGMLWYERERFGDFSVRLQFRDMSPEGTRANGGVFTRFPDPRTPLAERPPDSCGTVGSARTSQAWVAIYCGHEIQIYDGETGETQKTGSVYNFDPVGLPGSGATPKAVWNDYEIKVVGQHYTIIRNGVVINEFDNAPGKQSSRPSDPTTDFRQFAEGFLGLQNHGANDVIDLRNVRVRSL